MGNKDAVGQPLSYGWGMRVWRKYPKLALLAGLTLLGSLAMAEIIWIELPRSTPGSWPIPISREHDEFQVEETLEPRTEYTFTARGTLSDPLADRLFGEIELSVEEPGSVAPHVLTPAVNQLQTTFVTGTSPGLRRFRGKIRRWVAFHPQPGELVSIELVLSGGPRPWTAWLAIGVLVLCFVNLTGLAVYTLGSTLIRLLKRRPAS